MTYVSDTVWQGLDHHAGRLPRRTARRLAAAGAAAVALSLLAVAGWATGIIWPRIVGSGGQGWTADSAARTFEFSATIANNGVRAVTITGIGRDGPGLRLTGTTPALPFTLDPGEGTEIGLAYQVTSCDDVPTGDWPVPLRVDRLPATQTVWLHPQGTMPAAGPDSYAAPQDGSPAISWQVSIAALACERA